MPENKSTVFLVEEVKWTEGICPQPVSRLKVTRRHSGPRHVGKRKPQVWPAQKRGVINKCTQLPPSFRDWLRVCFSCPHYSLVKSQGLCNSLSHQGQSLALLIWAVYFYRAGPWFGFGWDAPQKGFIPSQKLDTDTHTPQVLPQVRI